jgi:uncharacterized protein YfaS (alpha-2-macroglobulin family)
LAPGSYILIVDVYDEVGGENYRDVINLKYQNKKFSPFIHTDKGIYKPGDTVKFSIFCIDSETKPFNPTSGSVTIYDSERSKIKTFTNITFVKGKYKGSFVLSENTAKGIWEVKFGAQNEVSSNISDSNLILNDFSVRFNPNNSKSRSTCFRHTQSKLKSP